MLEWIFEHIGWLIAALIITGVGCFMYSDSRSDQECKRAGGDKRIDGHCVKLEIVHVPAR